MKNNSTGNGYLFSKKGFYITVAIGIFAVIAAVVALQITSNKVKNDLTSFIGENSVPFSGEVQKDVSDIPDTRVLTELEASTDDTDGTEKETEPESKPAEKQTTVFETKAQSTSYTDSAEKIENASFSLPMESDTAKDFSPETPVFSKTMGDYRTHSGVDFEGSKGAEVYAVGNGKVTRVLADTMWGYIVEIDHGSFTARYIGLNQEDAVGIGQTVKAKQKIGTLALIPAESGDGFHLHFEVVKNGKCVEPFAALGVEK